MHQIASDFLLLVFCVSFFVKMIFLNFLENFLKKHPITKNFTEFAFHKLQELLSEGLGLLQHLTWSSF